MPLNLTSITLPTSNIFTEFVPFHTENGMSLKDLSTFIAHLNALPSCKLDLTIEAKSMHSMATIPEKTIRDNKAENKVLNLYISGSITLLGEDMSSVNSLSTPMTHPLEGNAANIVMNYLVAQPPFSRIEQFLYFCGYKKQEINNWILGWPEVQMWLKSKLSSM